jgi:DNA-binding transcriptional ArsR family regulator
MSKPNVYTNEQKKIAKIAKAISNPTRVAILQLLNSQACCYHGDMVDELPIAKSTLSQHLNELKAAGLIQGEIKPPTVKYCIHAENWKLAQQLFANFFEELQLKETCKK